MPQAPAPRGGLFGTGIGDLGPEQAIWDAITGNLPDLPGTTLPNRRNTAPAPAAPPGPMRTLWDSLTWMPPLNIFNEKAPDAPSSSPFAGNPQAAKGEEATPQAALPEGSPLRQNGGIMGSLGAVLSPPEVGTGGGLGRDNVTLPSGVVSQDAAIKAAMLQAGLSLMVPQWGGPLSQIGQAAGQGAEAFTRTMETGPRDVARALEIEKGKADIEGTRSLAEYRGEATKTAAEKRVKEKADRSTEFERMVKGIGLGPKGQAYLKTRIKSFDDITSDDASLEPSVRFNKIVEEARKLDAPAVVEKKAPNVGGTDTVQATETTPKVGEVRKGWKFKGGDPAQRSNWEKVAQ